MSNSFQHDDSQIRDTGPQGTRVFRREDIEQHIAERGGHADASGGAASGAVLVGVHGPWKGRRIDVPAGRSTLGRDVANNIVVDDDSVSLVHARLVEKNGDWRVLNLLSTNGTWINNNKVSDGPLRDGDSVRFGEVQFIFQSTVERRRPGLWNRLRRWLSGPRSRTAGCR